MKESKVREINDKGQCQGQGRALTLPGRETAIVGNYPSLAQSSITRVVGIGTAACGGT